MRKTLRPFLIAAGVFAAGLSACKSKDPVVARVGPLPITESEFHRKLAEVSPDYQNYVLTPDGRRQFLDILIREKLVLAAAQASGVRSSPEYRRQMDALKAEEDERLSEASEYLLTRLWIDDLRHKGAISVSDDEIKAYYDKHPEEVEVHHILLASPDQAQLIAKKARGGAGFSALAKTYSLDAATSSGGGAMAPAIYGEVIPDLQDAVFGMRVGEISGPIKSKFGYHIMKKEWEKRRALPEIRDRVSRVIEKGKLDDYLRGMQDKFPVEVLYEPYK